LVRNERREKVALEVVIRAQKIIDDNLVSFRNLVRLDRSAENGVNATVCIGDEVFVLFGVERDHGCCSCDLAKQDFFCIHHVLALAALHAQLVQQDPKVFFDACVRFCGSYFGATNGTGCTLGRDGMCPLSLFLESAGKDSYKRGEAIGSSRPVGTPVKVTPVPAAQTDAGNILTPSRREIIQGGQGMMAEFSATMQKYLTSEMSSPGRRQSYAIFKSAIL
jgi:hypothetical protein